MDNTANIRLLISINQKQCAMRVQKMRHLSVFDYGVVLVYGLGVSYVCFFKGFLDWTFIFAATLLII